MVSPLVWTIGLTTTGVVAPCLSTGELMLTSRHSSAGGAPAVLTALVSAHDEAFLLSPREFSADLDDSL